VTSAPAPAGAASRFADRYVLSDLLGTLSSRTSAAASGTAAGVSAALAAATVGKRARSAGDAGLAAQADALVHRLVELAAEDADAHDAARRALDEPRSVEGARDFQLGTVLHRAADVPLQIAEAAADVVMLAEATAEVAVASDRPDTTAAALLAAAAARAAAHLVVVNLAARTGDARELRAKAAVEAAARGAAALEGEGARG